MNQIDLYECASRLDFAKREMAAAVNQSWPVGTVVSVQTSRGMMRGQVVIGALEIDPEFVSIKNWKHKRSHRVHWRRLRKGEEYQ